MKNWSSVEWLKRLAVLFLVFLNVYILIHLLPFLLEVASWLFELLLPFFIAILIAYLLHPWVKNIHRKGVPRPVAILLIYTIFFGIAGYALFKGMPYLIGQLKSFVKQIPELTHVYKQLINDFYYATSDLPETVHDHFDSIVASLESWLEALIDHLVFLAKDLLTSIFTILLIPFLVFYFLKDWERIKGAIYRMSPQKWRQTGAEIARDIDWSLGSFIRGQMLVCSALALFAFIGLWGLNIPYALLLGLFIGMTDIIPYFGPLIGAIPAIMVALTLSLNKMLYVIGLILILQFLEGNVLNPLIVGKTVNVHPVTIILSLVVGEQIAGILGLLLAVPFYLVIRVVFMHIYKHYKKIDKENETRL